MMDLHFKKIKEKKFKIVDKESGYDKRIILKTFTLPNGMTENFFIDHAKDSVQIFALTRTQEVICVKQFRAGTEELELELPGGGLEEGEDPNLAAGRELQEETGAHVHGDVIFLASFPYNPYSTGRRYSFLATECEIQKELNLDPNEFLEVVLVPLTEFRELMKKGKVRGFDAAYLALDALGLLS